MNAQAFFRLDGKVAFVTGGGQGIGEAIARRLAAERADGDFRLVFNTGPTSGQTVFHVHAHVLAGDLTEGSLGLV